MLIDSYECWRCEKPVDCDHEPMNRVFCPSCFEAYRAEHKQLVDEYAVLKVRVMHENALRIMEKSGMYMYEYRQAAETVRQQAIADTTAYFSAHEMVTAIVLTEFGYEFTPNYSIAGFRVDFYIPELFVCVEVDGHLHDYKEAYDSSRDIDIRNALGARWEVVRIPTRHIESNPVKIPDAIEALADERRRLRKLNGGIIPESFSKRERKHYANVGEHYTRRVRKV